MSDEKRTIELTDEDSEHHFAWTTCRPKLHITSSSLLGCFLALGKVCDGDSSAGDASDMLVQESREESVCDQTLPFPMPQDERVALCGSTTGYSWGSTVIQTAWRISQPTDEAVDMANLRRSANVKEGFS